ncbi:cytochrome c [Achromobacter xylosoxidans]
MESRRVSGGRRGPLRRLPLAAQRAGRGEGRPGLPGRRPGRGLERTGAEPARHGRAGLVGRGTVPVPAHRLFAAPWRGRGPHGARDPWAGRTAGQRPEGHRHLPDGGAGADAVGGARDGHGHGHGHGHGYGHGYDHGYDHGHGKRRHVGQRRCRPGGHDRYRRRHQHRGPAPAAVSEAITLRRASGERIYQNACAVCHEAGSGPTLFGVKPLLGQNTNLHAASPDNLIQVILHGIQAPADDALGYMPAFGNSLDDRQIGDLIDYLRARFAPEEEAWPVDTTTIGRLRQHAQPQ